MMNPEWTGKEDPWDGVPIDLVALQKIVCDVLRVPVALCGPPVSLRDEEDGSCGSHGRIYSFQLPTRTVVARLITPVKPVFKTEGEVAAMDFVRSHTTLKVPKVFSYCSEADNPVGAEWMIMDYVPGKVMESVWDDLSLAQKQRLARDVIDIHAQLSKLKADGCGAIYHSVHSVDDFNLSRTPRWRPLSINSLRMLREYCSHSLKGGYKLGPLQSVPLVNYRLTVPPPAKTRPVYSTQEYVSLVAHNGHPTTWSRYELFARETCINLFELVHNLYPHSRLLGPLAGGSGYCFTHGDLHVQNILVDPDTGAITGILDWECAAFRPMWAEVAGIGWFVEDGHRMIFGCFEPANFDGETMEDGWLRALFRTGLNKRDSDLFTSFLGGSELRAICDAGADWPAPDGQMVIFLQNYHELGYWNENRRGPFPWDMRAWAYERIALGHEKMREADLLKSLQIKPSGSTKGSSTAGKIPAVATIDIE